MKMNLKWLFALMLIASFALVSCGGDDDSSEGITGLGSESDTESGSGSGSGTTANYTLSGLAGYWFGLDYDELLSKVATYTSQGNATIVKNLDQIYGFQITAAGEIREVVLYMSSTSSSTGDVHTSFFISGETIYWMLRDYGSYLSGVVVSGDEILYNGTRYFTIDSSSMITYVNGDLYKKR